MKFHKTKDSLMEVLGKIVKIFGFKREEREESTGKLRAFVRDHLGIETLEEKEGEMDFKRV